jgi:hypothetical protein
MARLNKTREKARPATSCENRPSARPSRREAILYRGRGAVKVLENDVKVFKEPGASLRGAFLVVADRGMTTSHCRCASESNGNGPSARPMDKVLVKRH